MTDQPDTVCHALPCSIEKDLTAPIYQYFHPTPVPADALPRNDGAKGNDDDEAVTVMAAQFRGRGLLCAVDAAPTDAAKASSGPSSGRAAAARSKLPPHILGVVLAPSSATGDAAQSPSSAGPPARPLKVVEKFRHLYNWRHEHDAQKLAAERRGSEKHGLNAVLGWCDLAHEVHDPIPISPS